MKTKPNPTIATIELLMAAVKNHLEETLEADEDYVSKVCGDEDDPEQREIDLGIALVEDGGAILGDFEDQTAVFEMLMKVAADLIEEKNLLREESDTGVWDVVVEFADDRRTVRYGLLSWSTDWESYFEDIDSLSTLQLAQLVAIKNDEKVGRGTCSSIDECYDVKELMELVSDCETVEGAIKRAREADGIFEERAAEIRSL